MKKDYKRAYYNVIYFKLNDVITASNENEQFAFDRVWDLNPWGNGGES